ncbi:ABC transporter permease [Oceanibacterium hippocampi]|uniref:Transport permease protein n=1 Tax=Oceanibacterium hippocampi TaxID=745714 RepID=A0A1Y5RW47_9PROT|nr:ABC transporter permease [Oceanibacterium hippocampi]SLN25488.1 Inner membrane transport permease YadH [Oceanibacterium hippocampi]
MIRSSDRPSGALAGTVNYADWLGLWTLYWKEVQRFLVVPMQTLAAPVMTTLLFFAIFSLAIGGDGRGVAGVPFAHFIAPGLLMMALLQNAFANNASSIMISKVQGNIVDVLMPPLSPAELTIGYVMAGVTRGLVVAGMVALVMWPLIGLGFVAPLLAFYFAFAGSLMMSLVGILTGLWADKFDHLATITNFVVTPLALLSGTFYSIDRLPESVQGIAQYNPIFFLIDGFRHATIGVGDAHPLTGAIAVGVIDAALAVFVYLLVRRGYNLRA